MIMEEVAAEWNLPPTRGEKEGESDYQAYLKEEEQGYHV